MVRMITKRLGELGYETKESDFELLLFCKNKVENYIKNYCNLPAVPEGLTEIFIDRACGEFLFSKLGNGRINSDELGNSEIRSISEGDVSVTFSEKNNAEKLIERLLRCGGDEINCYRKIRW